MGEEHFYCAYNHALNRLPREALKPTSLETFKNSLDTILHNVPYRIPLEQKGWAR